MALVGPRGTGRIGEDLLVRGICCRDGLEERIVPWCVVDIGFKIPAATATCCIDLVVACESPSWLCRLRMCLLRLPAWLAL